tara:strand:+ start:6540 stop:7217 length:678 start_codon:yes stop_codon:yes gene_type:complete
MKYIIASHHNWNKKSFDSLINANPDEEFYFITEKKDLNTELLKKLNPRYIFFPHWSYIVPKTFINDFECVCFHMTDLPYGRGGSPLQNLILRKHTETKISAIKMTDELDAGPVYFKKKLNLNGSAKEIYQRSSKIICTMIQKIISNEITPKKQVGKVTKFTRRKPSQSEIKKFSSVDDLYNFIRMLDAPNYPYAFIRKNSHIFEFFDAKLDNDTVIASVKIKKIK